MEQQQELDLKDLMFYILYRWKKLLIAAMLMAVLVGGYKMLSAVRSNASITDSSVNTGYEEELAVYEEQAAAVQGNINMVRELIATQETYINESILMNMDANSYYEGLLNIYISSANGNVLTTFRDRLASSNVQDSIATNMGWEVQYLSELVSVGLTSNSNLEGRLTIKVSAPSQDEATQLLKLYEEAYQSVGTEIANTVAEYEAEIMDNKVSKASSSVYAAAQKTAKDALTGYRTNLTNYQKSLDALVKPVAPAALTPTSPVKAGIKGAVIGAVLGIFLVAGCCCVSFVTGDRIYSPDELKQRKHMKIMGVLPDVSRKKTGTVKNVLRKMEGRKTDINEDRELNLIAANVNNYRAGAKVIMVTGTAEKAAILKVAKELRDRMPDIKVLSAGNMLNEASTLTHLPLCEGVVLVETAGKSHYKDLGLEIEKIQDLDKRLIGCVVMD